MNETHSRSNGGSVLASFLRKQNFLHFNPICPGEEEGEGGHIVPPPSVFDHYILTGRALKLILFDFSSNFILSR